MSGDINRLFRNKEKDKLFIFYLIFIFYIILYIIYIYYIYIKNKDPVKYFNFTETPCLNKVLLEINRTSYKKAFSFCKVISQITGFDL